LKNRREEAEGILNSNYRRKRS